MDVFDELYLKERLADAVMLLRSGRAADSIESAASALGRFFDRTYAKSRHRNRMFTDLRTEWPRRGVALAYDDGLKFSFERQDVEIETAGLYVSFISDYLARGIIRRRSSTILQPIWQKGYDFFRYAADSVPASWHGTRRLLNAPRVSCLKRTPDGIVRYQSTVESIGELLREPLGRSHTIFKNYVDYQGMLAAQERGVRRDPTRANDISAAFVWDDEVDYADFVRRDTRSRISTTMHFGNFSYAAMRVTSHTPPGRHLIQLRRGDQGVRDTLAQRAYEKRGVQHEVSRNGSMRPLDMIAKLRKGNTTLSALFDLNGNFGETTPVTFMGRTAHFAKGPAELAIIGRAPILMFLTYSDKGRDYLQIQELFDARLLPGESLPDGVQRLTQRLVTIAERWIRRYPHQWQYLQGISSYFRAVQ